MVAVTFNTFAEILPSYAFGSFFVEQGMFHFQGPCRIVLLLVLILLLLLFSPQSLWGWWCLSILCVGAKSFPTYNKDHHPPRQGLVASRRITLTNMNYANSVFALIQWSRNKMEQSSNSGTRVTPMSGMQIVDYIPLVLLLLLSSTAELSTAISLRSPPRPSIRALTHH